MYQESIHQNERRVESHLEIPEVSTRETLATKLQYAVTSIQSELDILKELHTKSEERDLSQLQKETFIARFSGLPQYSHENDSAITFVNSVFGEKN